MPHLPIPEIERLLKAALQAIGRTDLHVRFEPDADGDREHHFDLGEEASLIAFGEGYGYRGVLWEYSGPSEDSGPYWDDTEVCESEDAVTAIMDLLLALYRRRIERALEAEGMVMQYEASLEATEYEEPFQDEAPEVLTHA